MPDKRPSDNVKLAMNYPQEEEFGFMNCNPNSIYNFCYFPKNFQNYYDRAAHNTGLSKNEIELIAIDYIKLLKKAQIVSGKSQIIVKSPINTARIGFLNRNFPEAKYIHIVRNPYSVYLSARKFFTNLLPTLWFQEVSPDAIDAMVLELYTRLYEDYFRQKDLIRNRLIEVRFEDLEESPLDTLRKIYTNLEIKGYEGALPAFQNYISQHKDYQKNTYLISENEINRINNQWGKYIKHWDYNIPKNIKVSA